MSRAKKPDAPLIAAPRETVGRLAGDVRRIIESTRVRVAQSVNAELVMMNWRIGVRIHLDVLAEAKAEYGEQIQDIYAALTRDEARNTLIVNDVVCAMDQGRSPLVLTGRTEHISQIATALAGRVRNTIVLKGGMGRKQRREVNERLAAIPDAEQRLILTTGSYIGEGFDDARLDTLFLAMPISWKGTLQ